MLDELKRITVRVSAWLMAAGLCWAGEVPAKPGSSEPLDLQQRYATTLTSGCTNPAEACAWEFTPDDIYALSGFFLHVGDSWQVKIGPADLGIGHGMDVLAQGGS